MVPNPKARWFVVGIALLIAAGILGLAAHAPPARSLVLAKALGVLESSGIRASISQLDYNLLTLTFRARGVSLAAVGSNRPFFSADDVRVNVPWSIVRGLIAFDAIEVYNPSVTIVREKDGTFNLPRRADTASDPFSGPLDIDRLVVEGFRMNYEDRATGLIVEARDARLDLERLLEQPLSGRLSVPSVSIRTATNQTNVSKLEGRLTFDGRALGIDELTAQAPEGRARVDGTLALLPALNVTSLRYRVALELAPTAAWIGVDPAPSGLLSLSGTATGAVEDMTTTFDATANDVRWSQLGSINVNARGVVSPSAAAIEWLRASVAGGEVDGAARISFDDQSSGNLRLTWQNVRLQPILDEVANETVARIGSRANGSAELEWTGQTALAGRGRIVNTLAATGGSSGELPLSGNARLVLDDGTWQLSHDHRVAHSMELIGLLRGRIDPASLASSTLNGHADLNISSVSDALTAVGNAGLTGNLGDLSKLRGRASLTAALEGTIAAPRANGLLQATALGVGETGPVDATARYSATTERLHLETIEAALGSNTVTGYSAIDLKTRAIEGKLLGHLPDTALLASSMPAEWRPDGSAGVDVHLSGTLDSPVVTGKVTSDELRMAGQLVEHVSATARLANRFVTIERLNLGLGPGSLAATAAYTLSTGRFSSELRGTNLTLTATDAAPLPDATFDVELASTGTFDQPEVEGFVQFSRLVWEGFDVGPARMDVETMGGVLEASARAPELTAALEARIAVAEPHAFTADVSLDATNLSRLAGNGEQSDSLSLGGTVALRAHASGRLAAMADTTAELDVRLTDATVNGAPVRLARPARLRYSSDAIVADDLELQIGKTTLSANGRLAAGGSADEGLRISLTGNLADLVPLVPVSAEDALNASGPIDMQMRLTGRPRSPDISANVSLASASVMSGTIPPATDIGVNASFASGVLDVHDVRGAWQGASLTAIGKVPAAVLADRLPAWYVRTLPPATEPARAIVRLGSLTPSIVAPLVEEGTLSDVAGRIDGVVALTATSLDVGDIDADVTLERAELSLAKVPLNQSRPTRLRLQDGRLQVVDWTWAGAGNRVTVTGSAVLTDDSPVLDFAIDGTLDMRMLSAFSPGTASTGRAALEVKVTGRSDHPLVDGRMTIADGGLVVRDPRFAATDVQGTVTFARDALEIEKLTAIANGGTLQITGGLQYPKLTLANGSIAIRGRGLAVEAPEDLRSEVDTDLQLQIAGSVATLRGTLTVLRGSYREPISLAAQLLTGVETLPATPAARTAPGLIDRINLDIDVKTAEEVVVDNNYAQIDLAANLRIVGTIDEPVPTGRLTIEEGGEVYLGGRTYDVVRGTVDFTNPSRVEPTVDLALQTRVQRYDITLEVSGTPETLRANLRSPGVSQAELVSLLLTGQRGDPTAIAQTDIARGQLLMLLSGELLGFAGRAVGLDTVQLSHGLGAAASDFDLLATDTDPSARLTIGKHLSRNVEVVFSQALAETGDVTWIAIYRPIQRVEVRGATQDDGSRSYEFRHEFSFGGPVAPPSQSNASQRVVERVTTVSITGSPGYSDQDIRQQLDLAAGARFDFYRWQQDRDRLQRFYRERGFLEARIAARRTSAPAPSTATSSVALEYDINRGPQTKLTIDGHALPGAIVERMEDAWVSAVFDGFLLDDLTSIAREHLIADGYLLTDVQATVVSEPDSALKEIAVRIVPGTRFASRRIIFTGQQALSAGVLETAVRAQGADASMWYDPAALRSVVEQQYRAHGYLDAVVNVQPPTFSAESAELPVHITEGRQYTVGRIDVQGAQARSREQIAGVFGVATGSAFQPPVLEPSRRAVEVDYLRDGYNDVRVTVTTTVDAARGLVDLLLNVEEGRQQVLAEIDVKGADITRRGVIDRALDVEVGQPANQSEFFRAETRLYDTGAFRTADIALVPLQSGENGRLQRVRAEVSLEELEPYRFRYGFRVNDTITPVEIDRELRPALVVDFLRRNLFGYAISAGAAGQIEADRRLLRGVLTLPRFFGLPVTTNLFATTSREDFTPAGATPFVEDESSITAEQRFALSPKMAVSYSYDYSRSHIFEPDPLPGIPPLELQAKVARLTGTYAWDRRNDPFAPRDGWFHSSGVELGTKALGSDLRFVRYLVQQQYYRTAHRRLVLASSARLGLGRGFEQDLIPSERFYAGGGTSVRGFAEDALGEADFFGDPRGGNSMLVLNQEARMFLFGWVHAVAFLDAGNVFPKASDFSLTNLEAGTGGGLRINSPFALLRIDFGIPLTGRPRQPSGRWYFGIGHSF
jgi:outer membrane protein assembly complex protein YaeT